MQFNSTSGFMNLYFFILLITSIVYYGTVVSTMRIDFTLSYYVLLIISITILLMMIMLNVYVRNIESCKNSTNVFYTIFSSFITPFTFVFAGGILLLELIPGWHRPFSNTIGTFIMKLSGFNDFVTDNGLLKSQSHPENKKIQLLLTKVQQEPHILFNEVIIDNIEIGDDKKIKKWQSLDNLMGMNLLNESKIKNESGYTDIVSQLALYLSLKKMVSYFIWLLFLGMTTYLISVNNILLSDSCAYSSAEQKDFKSYVKSKEDKSE